jgi:hypothetical protein
VHGSDDLHACLCSKPCLCIKATSAVWLPQSVCCSVHGLNKLYAGPCLTRPQHCCPHSMAPISTSRRIGPVQAMRRIRPALNLEQGIL